MSIGSYKVKSKVLQQNHFYHLSETVIAFELCHSFPKNIDN